MILKFQDPKNKNILHLDNKGMKILEKGVQKHENLEIKLQARQNRVYLIQSKKNTPYLTWNADCKNCKVKYKFYIKQNPKTNDCLPVYINIQCWRNSEHNHQAIIEKKQLRGEDREKIVDDILIAGGSAYDYYTKQIAIDENPPSINVLHKALSQRKNKNVISTNWIFNILHSSIAYEKSLKGEKLHGYIQQLSIFKEFNMILHSETQLLCLKNIPYQHRVIHIDATGQLVRIPRHDASYKRLLNYFILLKDLREIKNCKIGTKTKSALISEMVSSEHDSYRITDFLNHLKRDYERVFSDNLSFRLVVSDFCWATMHSVVKSFNTQTLLEYATCVYELSINNFPEAFNKITWLCSCGSHTMKRFTGSVSKVILDNQLRIICCFSFTLLLNCTDLESMKQYFQLLCNIFLSTHKTNFFNECFQNLENAIELRPTDKLEIIKLCNNVNKINVNTFAQSVGDLENENSADNLGNSTDEQVIKKIKKDSIKNSSPFTPIFTEIYESTRKRLEKVNMKNSTRKLNNYYCPTYIQFLLDKYMPYCFIWSSFVLRDIITVENGRSRYVI
jgi:hypothetical protein